MSLLKRIKDPRGRILKKLIEELFKSEPLQAPAKELLENILAQEDIDLDENDHQRLLKEPSDYLLESGAIITSRRVCMNTVIPNELIQRIMRQAAETGHPLNELVMTNADPESLRAKLVELFESDFWDSEARREPIILARRERERLYDQLVAEMVGFGPLEPLLADPEVTHICVLGPKNIHVQGVGRRALVSAQFENETHLRRVVDRLITPLNERIDDATPMLNVRLPDGSRLSVVMPPIAVDGIALTISKAVPRVPLTVQDLITFNSTTDEQMAFLRACVVTGLNIVVSGSGRTGKTALLNILGRFIPEDRFIALVESITSLQLRQKHVLRLQSRPPNLEGKGEVPMRALVRTAAGTGADVVLVDELRGGEALDLIQEMGVGQPCMATINAHRYEALKRLETMYVMGGGQTPAPVIREQIARTVDLIVHLDRMRDGSRKITTISEVLGMEGDKILLQDIFTFEQTGLEDKRVVGQFHFHTVSPQLLERIEGAGGELPPAIFES